MFGYIGVNQKELKGKEMDRYQSYYCGLCRSLKERHGAAGQMTLSYDITFLAILLTGLYEPENREEDSRCILHPIAKRHCIRNEYVDYCADMNVMLSYFKCLDDWEDEKKILKLALAGLLKGKNKRIQNLYEEKAKVIYDNLKAIQDCEKKDVDTIANIDSEIIAKGQQESVSYGMDTAAGYFGKIMEELFLYRRDEWEPALRRMGFYLGKFLYLMDAYEDMEKDVRTGNYNPVLKYYRTLYSGPRNHVTYLPEFEERIKQILRQMIAESARAFEHLPVIEEAEILRNILYSGVWCRYVMISEKRKKAAQTQQKKKEEKRLRQEERESRSDE